MQREGNGLAARNRMRVYQELRSFSFSEQTRDRLIQVQMEFALGKHRKPASSCSRVHRRGLIKGLLGPVRTLVSCLRYVHMVSCIINGIGLFRRPHVAL